MESSPSFIKTAYQVLAIENDGKRSAVTFCYPAIKVLVGPARLELATKGL